MQTKAKATSVITHSREGSVIKFNVLGAGPLVDDKPTSAVLELDLTKVDAGLRERAETHGWIQRVSDAAAIPFDKALNRYATPAEKFDAMKRLVDHYVSGATEWSPARQAGGNEGGLLLRCLVEVYGEAKREALKTWVGKQSAAARAALLLEEPVKAVADRLRAEGAKATDVSALMGELEGL